jgi:hypothetical protein
MEELTTDLDRKGVAFIIAGQSGWFETRSELNAPAYRASANDVVDVLGTINFFAPIARKTKGMRDSDAATVANVVWADVDLPTTEDPTVERKQQLLHEIQAPASSVDLAAGRSK